MIVGWRFKCSASDQNKNDINTIKSYVGLVYGDDMIKEGNDLGTIVLRKLSIKSQGD